MHDLDGVSLEELETTALDEVPAALGSADAFEQSATSDEAYIDELGAQLVGLRSDEEIDLFLSKLLGGARRLSRTSAGRALAGILRRSARKALPMLGGAVGAGLGGSAGARSGAAIARTAGQIFGLELAGLPGEEQEFQLARAFGRFAKDAVANLAAARPQAAADPAGAARRAAIAAARRYAPGLLRPSARAFGLSGFAPAGRWVRRGRRIVLVGV